jgi:hypothetical protein
MINIKIRVFNNRGGMAEKDEVIRVSEKAKRYFDQGFN